MSVEAIAWALDQSAPTPTAKLVLIGLANHAHKDGTRAFPSVSTLATYADCDPRSVKRCLRALEEAGLIAESDWQPENIRADRRPTCYVLAMSRGDEMSPRKAPRGDHTVRHGVTVRSERGDPPVTRTVLEPSVEPLVLAGIDGEDKNTEPIKKKNRERDETWDAVVEACGLNVNELTGSARGAVNKAVKELKEIGASPEGIRARAKIHLQKWPDATLTATSLAKNYAQLAAKPNGARPAADAMCNIFWCEQPQPCPEHSSGGDG